MLTILLLIDLVITFILILMGISEFNDKRSIRLMSIAVIGVVIAYVLLYIGVTTEGGV
jgi:predicted branched-subunit amino acid permease